MPASNDWLSLEGVVTVGEWADAIAVDAEGHRIQDRLADECELGQCCRAISEVRDLLARGMLARGLSRTEARDILPMFNQGCHSDFLREKIVAGTALGRILRALEVDAHYYELWPMDRPDDTAVYQNTTFRLTTEFVTTATADLREVCISNSEQQFEVRVPLPSPLAVGLLLDLRDFPDFTSGDPGPEFYRRKYAMNASCVGYWWLEADPERDLLQLRREAPAGESAERFWLDLRIPMPRAVATRLCQRLRLWDGRAYPEGLVRLKADNLPAPMANMGLHTNEADDRCRVAGCDTPTQTGICACCAHAILEDGEARFIHPDDLAWINEHNNGTP